jgi:hypothetical protein
MKPTETRLTATLYRAFCPDTSELGEYHFEMSPPERAAFIRDHLKECPHCRRELHQLGQFLMDVSPDLEFSPIERFKIWVAELLPELPGSSVPLALEFRGETTGQKFYQAGDVQITIEVQDDPASPGNKLLLGLVLGISTDEMRVQCLRDELEVVDSPVDDLGNFVLSGLEPGNYNLILRDDEVEIQIPDLLIEPAK